MMYRRNLKKQYSLKERNYLVIIINNLFDTIFTAANGTKKR